MKKVFVTGGSGFVGRNLIRVLLERGYAVCAIARSASAAQTIRQLGAEPVDADIANVSGMIEAMRGSEFVVHAAAKVEDWGRAEDFYAVNVTGTENVLRAAETARVP